jgi:hypothetical protein
MSAVHFEIQRSRRDYLYRLPGEAIPTGIHLPMDHHTHQALVNLFCNHCLDHMLEGGIGKEDALRSAQLFSESINLVLEENMVEYLIALAINQPQSSNFDLESLSDLTCSVVIHAAAKQFDFAPAALRDKGTDFADGMMRSAHKKLHERIMSKKAES